MAIEITSQYKYKGRGPLDAKALVNTLVDLTKETTWQNNDGMNTAYNGLIVTVGLDNTGEGDKKGAKNGVYYLRDNTVTTIFTPPDVTKESNWHKLAEESKVTTLIETVQQNVSYVSARLAAAEDSIKTLQDITSSNTSSPEALETVNKAITNLQELTGDKTKGNEALYSSLTELQSAVNSATASAADAMGVAATALGKAEMIESDYLKAADGYILSCGTSMTDVQVAG